MFEKVELGRSFLTQHLIAFRANQIVNWITGSGNLNGQAIHEIFRIVDQHKHMGDGQFVVDLINATLSISVIEIEDCLEAIKQTELTKGCRLAVLYASQNDLQTTRFKFLETLSDFGDNGLKMIRVFDNEHDALVWLEER